MNKIESDILNERRKTARVSINLPVNYKNLRKIGSPSMGSLTRDISEGGVRFKSNEFISLACRLVVEIALPTGAKPVKAISKVAWIRRLPTTDEYELGNQFLEMSREDRSRVIDFITRVLNKTA